MSRSSAKRQRCAVRRALIRRRSRLGLPKGGAGGQRQAGRRFPAASAADKAAAQAARRVLPSASRRSSRRFGRGILEPLMSLPAALERPRGLVRRLGRGYGPGQPGASTPRLLVHDAHCRHGYSPVAFREQGQNECRWRQMAPKPMPEGPVRTARSDRPADHPREGISCGTRQRRVR